MVRFKIRRELADEYKPNLGLDGHCCGFLAVAFLTLVERVQQGGSDEEILKWCYFSGHRPNAVQKRIWNNFASKMGWNDPFSAFVEAAKVEQELANRHDLATAFAVMDFREDRAGEEHDHSL